MWRLLTYGLPYYHDWIHHYFESTEFTYIRYDANTKPLTKQKVLKRKKVKKTYEELKIHNKMYAQKYRDANKDNINKRLRLKRQDNYY